VSDTPSHDSPFNAAGFDLDAYLDRIGYRGPAPATFDTLAAIAELHPAAIPFENLDAYLRVPVMLDPASLQRKLVRGGRGGWCFEHNLLLGTALTAIGFRPLGLGARVLWNVPNGVVGARSHMVLLIDLDGTRFIVDAGFGGLTLTAPLRLEPDLEQATPHERFRLRPLDDDLVLEAEIRPSGERPDASGDWRPLYRFDLAPQRLSDYEVSNWYLCNWPQSHFLGGILAARAMPGRRHALRGTELTTHHANGSSERRVLASGADIRTALEDTFGIAVPSGAAVNEALDRLVV
jgi:N-hydroxyarylamine O-acetyltransferase